MVAIYKIQSKIIMDKDYNCVYKSIDAILPKLIDLLYSWDYDFEITAIDDEKHTVIIQVYYEYDKRQDICQLFSVCTKEFSIHYNIVATQGVL